MRPPPPEAAIAAAIDMGSTRIKFGWMDGRGRLAVRSADFPPARRHGNRWEGDALAVSRVVHDLIRPVADRLPAGCPVGIASQRSSFVLWDRGSCLPVTPLICWQDRRAESWCARNAAVAGELFVRTGLVLSPHHAGPKLAAMQEEDPDLTRRLNSGKILFGTLETFLVWQLTGGRLHATDVSMAGRTGLVDLYSGCWSEDLLGMFGVPEAALPRILATSGRSHALSNGLTLAATLADQAAGALSVLDMEDRNEILINGGTGTFLLRPVPSPDERRLRYLLGPLLGNATGISRYALEATVHGGSRRPPSLPPSGALPAIDPAPEAFCLPEESGLGAPRWRPDVGFTLSLQASGIGDSDRARVVLEGVLFRCVEILEEMCPNVAKSRIVVSGGLSRDPAFGIGLSALVDRPVEIVADSEGTLTGTVRLAAGLDPRSPRKGTALRANGAGAYLPEKYRRWRAWVEDLLQ